MKSYEVELNGETVKFRLSSADSIEIEKKTGKSILELLDDYSVTNTIMFLKYMRRSELPQFSDKDAYELYDKFIDNGYTLEKIVFEIVYEGLCISGFFKREKLDELKKELAKLDKK